MDLDALALWCKDPFQGLPRSDFTEGEQIGLLELAKLWRKKLQAKGRGCSPASTSSSDTFTTHSSSSPVTSPRVFSFPTPGAPPPGAMTPKEADRFLREMVMTMAQDLKWTELKVAKIF